jgi:hypothetical protein
MPENADVPQFQTAEFHDQPSADVCCICQQPISGSYYRIRGAQACTSCSQQVLARKPLDSHAAFTRAILFGLGGALLGLILYSAVGILFHLEIGFVSLAVGYLVGKAMMKGSGNIGGRRYQWIAVVLTYAAVSLAVVPVMIAQYIQEKPQHTQVQPSKGSQAQGAETAQTSRSEGNHKTPYSFGKAVAALALFGLASPFLGLMANPVSGALGIIILLVGVRIAWQITAGVQLPTVEGPY